MLSQRYFLDTSESGEKTADLGLVLDFDKSGLRFTKCPSFPEQNK